MAPHLPRVDELPPSPVDWAPIPLGVGQEPNAMGHDGSFEHTQEGDAVHRTDVRRKPGETVLIIGRYPERW